MRAMRSALTIAASISRSAAVTGDPSAFASAATLGAKCRRAIPAATSTRWWANRRSSDRVLSSTVEHPGSRSPRRQGDSGPNVASNVLPLPLIAGSEAQRRSLAVGVKFLCESCD